MIDPARILVTGGNGRLGKALAGKGCTALGRDEINVTDVGTIYPALERYQPTLIINAAAYTAVDLAESHKAAAHLGNVEGAGLIAAACSADDIPLIHISTDCVFGDAAPDAPMHEDAPTNPLSYYGQSKLEGEQLVRHEASKHCIARVSWLFDGRPDTFISKMLSAAQKRDSLKVVDEAYGRPTPTTGLADYIIQLADLMISGADVPDILHVGPPGPVSRYEWATEIFAASADLGGPNPLLTPCEADAFPEVARRPRGLILDVSRAEALLGPMPDWRPACREAVKSLLS